MLDVVDEMRLVQPNASVHISRKSTDRFVKKIVNVIKTGFGQPSIFNSDAVVQELLRQGKNIVDARCGGTSGCVESGAFGKENYTLTGYFNIPKVLELTINNGTDPLSGKKIGLEICKFEDFKTFDDYFCHLNEQLQNEIIERTEHK